MSQCGSLWCGGGATSAPWAGVETPESVAQSVLVARMEALVEGLLWGQTGARHLLLCGRERLRAGQRRRLCELFAHDPVIAEAWWLKEALRSVYAASDRQEAQRRLERFLEAARRSGC